MDVAAAYAGDPRPKPGRRPWVVVDMVASIDGATAVQGRSGALGGAGDKAVFRALRAVADVVLVAAGTARAENYGAVTLDDDTRRLRTERGQAPLPRLALVSGRLDLDPAARMFSDAALSPIVFTTEDAPPDRVEALRAVAEVVAVGSDSVDLGAVLGHLDGLGVAVVLCEGGPSLNGQMVESGLVDEWCQSVAPLLVAGGSARVAHGATEHEPLALPLRRLLEDDGYLFARYARA